MTELFFRRIHVYFSSQILHTGHIIYVRLRPFNRDFLTTIIL